MLDLEQGTREGRWRDPSPSPSQTALGHNFHKTFSSRFQGS